MCSENKCWGQVMWPGATLCAPVSSGLEQGSFSDCNWLESEQRFVPFMCQKRLSPPPLPQPQQLRALWPRHERHMTSSLLPADELISLQKEAEKEKLSGVGFNHSGTERLPNYQAVYFPREHTLERDHPLWIEVRKVMCEVIVLVSMIYDS